MQRACVGLAGLIASPMASDTFTSRLTCLAGISKRKRSQ